MRSFLRKTVVCLAFLITSLFLPRIVFADTIFLSPSLGNYQAGQTFAVRVLVSSPVRAINAASGVLSFPPDKLQVVSVSKTNSILNLWVSEPSFSNSQGTVSFEGVVPNPGFTGNNGTLVTVNFKVFGSGTAGLRFSSGSLLANDGSGTNVLKTLGTASFTIGGSQPAPLVAPISSDAGGLIIKSSTHPDSRKWYSVSDTSFSWNLPAGTAETRLLLSKLPNATPTVKYSPAISSKEIEDVEEGIWYLHVRTIGPGDSVKNASFRFNIDTSNPENFSVREIKGDDPTNPRSQFAFFATDMFSGISRYVVSIDKGEEITWRDDGTGVFVAPILGPGKHSLVVQAYDEAGNFATDSVEFNIEGLISPEITYYDDRVSEGTPLTIRGDKPKNLGVKIFLERSDVQTVSSEVPISNEEVFSAIIETNKLENGAYKLWAISYDKRGATSQPTAQKTVYVGSSWLESFGSTVMKILTLLIPIIALVIGLALLLIYGVRKVTCNKKDLQRELQQIDRLVNKSFELLKEDIADSIHLLEHTQTKRKLTKEEDMIIRRLRQNLDETEKLIHKEVIKAEKQIEK